MPRPSSRAAFWLFGLLTFALAFAGADLVSLKGCDEAFYAQVAREMYQGGDWLTPHYTGAPNFEKPPFLFWLVSFAYALLGVGDLQARLPVLVAGILGVALTALAAWIVRREARTALLAGGVVATTGLYLQVWHQVMIDVPAYAALALMALGLLGMERDRRLGWLVGPGLGLLILAKGALAALILLACVPYLLWRRPRPTPELGWGVLVGLSPAVAWYGAMHAEHGADFWRIHLGQQVLQRAQSGLFAKDPLGPAFYVVHMLGTFLPWSFLVPGAVVAGWRRLRAGDGPAVFALGFLAVFLLVISLMQTKFEHYALPLLLPVALLIGDWAQDPDRASDRWVGGAYLVLALLLGVAVGVVKALSLPLGIPQTDLTLAALGLLACALAWAGVAFARRLPRKLGARRLLLGSGLSFVAAAQFVHPWDAVPGMRLVAGAVPPEAPAHLVMPVAIGEDFCTYAAIRFRLPGALDVMMPDQVPHGPKGWYLGKVEDLKPQPTDRRVVEGAGWRVMERR